MLGITLGLGLIHGMRLMLDELISISCALLAHAIRYHQTTRSLVLSITVPCTSIGLHRTGSTTSSLVDGTHIMTLSGPEEPYESIYTKNEKAERLGSPSPPHFFPKFTRSSITVMVLLSLALSGILFVALGSASSIPATASRRTAGLQGRPHGTYTNRAFSSVYTTLTLDSKF